MAGKQTQGQADAAEIREGERLTPAQMRERARTAAAISRIARAGGAPDVALSAAGWARHYRDRAARAPRAGRSRGRAA
jgi:hypothetical protein